MCTKAVVAAERQEEDECYVCTEAEAAELPLVQVCSCSSRIHLKCQRAIIDKMPAFSTRCSVCKNPYNNITIEASAIRVTAFGWLMMSTLLLKACLISTGVYLLVNFALDPSSNLASLIGGILISVSLCIFPIAFAPFLLIFVRAILRHTHWAPIGNGENYILRRKYTIKVHPQQVPVKKPIKVISSSSHLRHQYLAMLEKSLIYDPMREAEKVDAPQVEAEVTESTSSTSGTEPRSAQDGARESTATAS